jgi:hypothetical protein
MCPPRNAVFSLMAISTLTSLTFLRFEHIFQLSGYRLLHKLSYSESCSPALNGNGTVTFSPSPNFAGVDKFSYTISDGKVKSDDAQVSVLVKRVADDISKRDQTDPLKTGKEQQQQQQQTGQGDDVIVPLKNLDDSSVKSKDLKSKSVQNAGRDNDTSASKP